MRWLDSITHIYTHIHKFLLITQRRTQIRLMGKTLSIVDNFRGYPISLGPIAVPIPHPIHYGNWRGHLMVGSWAGQIKVPELLFRKWHDMNHACLTTETEKVALLLVKNVMSLPINSLSEKLLGPSSNILVNLIIFCERRKYF